jgi:hypothetical protein
MKNNVEDRMMVWILWCFLFSLILYFLNLFIKTVGTPNRKFKHAVKHKRYYIIDDRNNVRKNFLLTYKGVVFEGEKHLGPEKNSFRVDSIYVWAHNSAALTKVSLPDLLFIEQKIQKQYPKAKINWNNPFFELMR